MQKTIMSDGCVKVNRFCCFNGASAKIVSALKYVKGVAEQVTGEKFEFLKVESLADAKNGVLFATFSDIEFKGLEKYEQELLGSDGYAVIKAEESLLVLSHEENGVLFGAYGLLEDSLDLVWARGAKEFAFDYLPSKFEIKKFDYVSKSPFRYRVWNMCGTGSTGEGHYDDGSAEYYARNKINGIFHSCDKKWKEYGLKGFGVVAPYANNINFLIESHPEYFMTDIDGKPKQGQAESFINYYNKDVAKIVASRFVEFLNEEQTDKDCVYNLIMPDNPYFNMEVDGEKLSEKPFTTDCGVTVYPTDENYKSTVYFNYMNRVAEEINRLRPNTEIVTFAYLYSEKVPAIKTHENLIVSLAPIYTNEKYAYTDKREGTGNQAIADNIEKWAKVCKKLCIYTYWNSFQGTIYMRPILRQVKENLKWFKKLGVYGLTPEGKLDCSIVENMSEGQKSARKFFDMNEACTFVINKLTFNPELDIDELLNRFAKIVYKEAAEEFLEYYYLIEKGFNHKNAYVWYPTGGDVYNLQFVVEAGIKDSVLCALDRAEKKATTLSVKERISSINATVKEQMRIYGNFVREDAFMTYCDKGEQIILSEKQMDYRNNKDSVWNKTPPLKVLRNYSTMEFYPEQADFECRILCDDKNVYFGYSVLDERIEQVEKRENGHVLLLQNGKPIISYAETYIGGNELNKSVYYGYISGFRQSEKDKGFYRNEGVPKNQGLYVGMKDAYFAKTSINPKERYLFHVQVIPIESLGVTAQDFKPYGSFVYYNDGYGRAGWMGFGLWSKQNFQTIKIRRERT